MALRRGLKDTYVKNGVGRLRVRVQTSFKIGKDEGNRHGTR